MSKDESVPRAIYPWDPEYMHRMREAQEEYDKLVKASKENSRRGILLGNLQKLAPPDE